MYVYRGESSELTCKPDLRRVMSHNTLNAFAYLSSGAFGMLNIFFGLIDTVNAGMISFTYVFRMLYLLSCIICRGSRNIQKNCKV